MVMRSKSPAHVAEFACLPSHQANVMFYNQEPPMKEQVKLMYRIARGVSNLHINNIFHLDLKVENIMISSDCQPKLIDFGIARSILPEVEVIERDIKHG
eukprot:scaffold290100_cov50-Prasinocladus_malaysianus.AAC.1